MVFTVTSSIISIGIVSDEVIGTGGAGCAAAPSSIVSAGSVRVACADAVDASVEVADLIFEKELNKLH
ncbi:MAG: hypothetical protein O3A77_01285, partial [bacterium]|nr:hypothetical protein [bacterium]